MNHELPRERWKLLKDHVRKTCDHLTDTGEAERLRTLVERYDALIADAGTSHEVHNLIEEYQGLAGLEGLGNL